MSDPVYNNTPGDATATKLILTPTEQQVLVYKRETDARTGLARGLAEYFKKLSVQYEGKELRFKRCFHTWAEPEVDAVFPSLCVWAVQDGAYDDSSFTPAINEQLAITDRPGQFFSKPTELIQDLTIDAWVSGVNERVALTQMMETAMFPVGWMYGFRLQLPHYHGAHAVYEPLSINYVDDDRSAQNRIRRVNITVRGRVPLLRPMSPIGQTAVVPAEISLQVEVVAPCVELPGPSSIRVLLET